MRVIDDRWIQVVDGVRRTPAKPKKKSLRHVWVREEVDPELGAKFEKGADVPNSEIQSALRAWVREEEEVG